MPDSGQKTTCLWMWDWLCKNSLSIFRLQVSLKNIGLLLINRTIMPEKLLVVLKKKGKRLKWDQITRAVKMMKLKACKKKIKRTLGIIHQKNQVARNMVQLQNKASFKISKEMRTPYHKKKRNQMMINPHQFENQN